MVSIGTLFAFLLVCGAVMYLRRSAARGHARSARPPCRWLPMLGIASRLLLMVGLPLDTWLRLIVWLAIGLVIYFGYGRHHSLVAGQPASSLSKTPPDR